MYSQESREHFGYVGNMDIYKSIASYVNRRYGFVPYGGLLSMLLTKVNQDISEQELKSVVAKAGYDVVSVESELYEKKGLFFAFRR